MKKNRIEEVVPDNVIPFQPQEEMVKIFTNDPYTVGVLEGMGYQGAPLEKSAFVGFRIPRDHFLVRPINARKPRNLSPDDKQQIRARLQEGKKRKEAERVEALRREILSRMRGGKKTA